MKLSHRSRGEGSWSEVDTSDFLEKQTIKSSAELVNPHDFLIEVVGIAFGRAHLLKGVCVRPDSGEKLSFFPPWFAVRRMEVDESNGETRTDCLSQELLSWRRTQSNHWERFNLKCLGD
jgi:hypothetical protein